MELIEGMSISRSDEQEWKAYEPIDPTSGIETEVSDEELPVAARADEGARAEYEVPRRLRLRPGLPS